MPDLEIDELVERVEEIPYAPWVTERPKGIATTDTLKGMDFSAGAGLSPGDAVATALTTPIHEGGAEDRNRWSEFSRVAGHFIRCARSGYYDLNEAAKRAYDWMLAEMKPVWPDARFEQEFRGVLKHDIGDYGPWPEPTVKPADLPKENRGLAEWDVGHTIDVPPDPRRFLVQSLMQAGVVHTLAAEGGAGKTFMCLDLGLKLAAAGNGMVGEWMGHPVTKHTEGGTVIMMTAEDDKQEIHIRLADIDPTGALRKAARGRFRTVPLVNAGGAFPLVAHSRNGEPEASSRWVYMLALMDQIVEDGGRIMAVIIDTMASTLHGEENSSTVITEYLTEAGRLCGKYGAAVIVTHHIRKGTKDQPIASIEDMKMAVRGSGAIMGSSRVVWGLWHDSNYPEKLKSMDEPVQAGVCYQFAVLKANNPEMNRDVRTLLREPNGLLVDVTSAVGKAEERRELRCLAWLVHAVEQAVLKRKAFTTTGQNGLFARRHQLPDDLKRLKRAPLEDMAKSLCDSGKLVTGTLATGQTSYLDVPEGPLSRGQGYRDPGSMEIDWGLWRYRPATGEIVAENRPFPVPEKFSGTGGNGGVSREPWYLE